MFWPPCPAARQAADPKGERFCHPFSSPSWPVTTQDHPKILTFVFPPLLLPPTALRGCEDRTVSKVAFDQVSQRIKKSMWSGLPCHSCSNPTCTDPTVLLQRQGHKEPVQALPQAECSEKPLYRNLTAESADFLPYHDLGLNDLPLICTLQLS